MKKYATYGRRTAALFSVVFLLGGALLYQSAPYMILTPRKFNLRQTPADRSLPYEKIEVNTSDSLTLRGYWVHRPGETGRPVIILLHGVGGCKEMWLPTAAWLWQEGFETVFLDNRAHGESGGQYCTYGFYEKYDVSAITGYIQQRKSGEPIGVWGNSLGGAIAVQALAVEPRLAFGIVESTFADLRTIVFDYQRRRLKIPWAWFADDGMARAAAMAHFEPDSVRPAELAKRVRQPVFLAHGDADDRIKVEYGRQIFDNLGSIRKQLYLVPGAGHLNVMAKGGPAYKNAILQFIKQ